MEYQPIGEELSARSTFLRYKQGYPAGHFSSDNVHSQAPSSENGACSVLVVRCALWVGSSVAPSSFRSGTGALNSSLSFWDE